MKTKSTPANGRTSFSAPGLNGQAATAAAHIDGRALDRMLLRSTASQKAVIADDIHTGRLVVSPLTARQSRLLAKASLGYTYTAAKLTEAERTAIINGGSLSSLHQKPSVWAAMARATDDRAALRDALDQMAAHVPEEMLAALDRATAPPTTSTGVNGNGASAANGPRHANNNDLAGQMAFSL